jgi:hypothetical protein
MCFQRRERDERLSSARRPTRDEIRELFERYKRPIRVGENVGEEAEPTHAKRPENVSRSPRGEPVGLR